MKKAKSNKQHPAQPVLVFFAVRSHHRKYFAKLAHTFANSQVVTRKHWWLPSLFARSPQDSLATAVDCLVDELASKWPWARPFLPLARLYLLLRARLLFACYCRMLQVTNAQHLAVWNGQRYRQQLAIAAAQAKNIGCLFFENGLLPDHTTIDRQGVNYLNSMPRDPAIYLARNPAPAVIRKKTRRTKAPAGHTAYILVPFQVETDSQILRFSPWIHSMRALFELLIAAAPSLPPGWCFLCKTHPAESKKHSWLGAQVTQHQKISLASDGANTSELIRKSQAVLTINSTVGIEALLAGKKVIAIGKAFYAFEGMVLQAHSLQELCHMLKKLHRWQPDKLLLDAFLDHLFAYQVPGDWRKADALHIQTMHQRITQLLPQDA